MDFIYNAMMASVKTPQERPSQGAEKKSDSDGFQKLMDQKQTVDNSAAASGPEQPQQTEGVQPQEAEAVQPVQDPRELEKRMAMAAMVMAQNPEVAELVADIAEETPQILTDPSWEEGFVPVGYDDYDGYRIVHWMQPEAAGENLQSLNEEAGKWVEQQQQQQTQEAAPETAGKDSVLPKLEVPVEKLQVEVKAPEAEAETEGEVQDAPVETPVFEHVRAVPVKVGEAAPAEETETPVEEQVVPKLAEAIQNGETRVELQLTPEHLGKIQVEMTWKEDGSLVVRMHADNGRTQSLLEKNAHGLEALLGRESQQEVRVEVPRQEDQPRQDLYEQQQRQQQQQHQREQQKQAAKEGEDFLHQLRLGLIPME